MGTVSKAMNVLEAFSPEEPEFGLSELARRLKFDKATTLRLLTSMMAHGLVEKTDPGKSYRLGPAVHRLARVRSATLSLIEIAQPVLDKLRDETGESCHLSEASQDCLATTVASHSTKALRINFTIGAAMPFHCTASGIVYLAFARPDVLERVARGPLPRITSRSKTTAAELRQKVAEATARGFALNNGEFDEEAVSVAAPIRDSDGFAFAALSVAAPRSRTDERLLMRQGQLVVRAARDLTAALGGKSLRRKA